MKTIVITWRSKLGWEYNTCSENDENGNWFIPLPDEPYYEGTYRQVCKNIQEDKTFASVQSGNTYFNRSWFVKYNKKWHRIIDNEKWQYQDLYWDKEIQVDIIYPWQIEYNRL